MTSCTGANGLASMMLLGTPFEGHWSATFPLMYTTGKAGSISRANRAICFAGIWTEFKGDRGTKSKPIPGSHNVYGFLTTSPNAVVEPIHPKAMKRKCCNGR